MQWGESRNIKVVRAFLIAFPSLFVFGFFFSSLDLIREAHGASLIPVGVMWLVTALLVAVSWLPPVPNPSALRPWWRGGSKESWRWRSLRAVMIFALVLAVFGAYWDTANAVTIADLQQGSEDWWIARSLFAGLYAISSLLFIVRPGEALAGDLRPFGPAERAAVTRLAVSFLLGWLLVAGPALAASLSFPGTDVVQVLLSTSFFGFFFGLLLFTTWGLVRSRSLVDHLSG